MDLVTSGFNTQYFSFSMMSTEPKREGVEDNIVGERERQGQIGRRERTGRRKNVQAYCLDRIMVEHLMHDMIF